METIKKYNTSDFKLKDKVIINLGEAGKGVKSFWVDGVVSDIHPNKITVERKNPFGNELLEEQIANKLLTSEYIVKEEDAEMYANGGEVNEFDYMMLSRLKSDADYYLGYGNRNEKRLWALNVDDHIKEMKNRWNALPEDKKPEWLTMEDILEYEKKMKNPTKSKFSYYKVPNEELYAIQECNPEYKDGFGSECIVIRTKKTEEAAIAEVERLNKLGYSDYAKGGELPQQKDIELLQKGLENPLIPQNVKTKIEAKIKELQSEIDKKQQEAKKAAEKPTLKDLEARLKIVKKMAAQKPELKARVKIIEKMIAKEKKATPKMEDGGVTTIMTTRDVTTTEDLNESIMPYNRVDGKIFEITSNLGRNRKYEWKGGDDGTLVRKETPKMENGGETTTFIIGNRYKRDSGMGGTLSFEYKGIKDGELVFKNVMHKDYGGGNTETYNLKAAKNTFKPDIKMENGGEFDLELGGYEYKMISSPTISYLRKEYKEELKNPEYSIIELPKQHPDRKRGNKFGLFKKKNRLTDYVNSFRNALVSYVKERYNEDVDLDNTLISYVENTNNKQVERAEVTTLQGNEYTVYPADLVDRFENGGSIPVNIALQKTAGQPYEIIKTDIPKTEAQKFIEEYKQSGKPYHNIMIDDLPFEDGGGVPEELKGYRVEIYTSYDGNQPLNVVSNGQFKDMVLVTDGKTGDSSVVMSDEPYLRLQNKNVFGEIYTSVVPVNIADKEWKMFGGNFVWSSDSRFREEVSEHPLPLHDRVEYEDGGEIDIYTIFEGYDHYNQIPLFQVKGKNNDYVGEWHDDRKDAEEELEDLMPQMKNGGEIKKEDIEILGVPRSKISEKEWKSILSMAKYQNGATFILKDENGLDVEPQVEYEWYVKEKMKKGGETWIQDATKEMKKKGTVGSFTNKAARHGLTPIEYAKKVLANPDKHTEKTRRQAQFVKNTNPEKFN